MSNLFLAKPANKSLMNFVSLLITMKLLIALALYLMEKIRKKKKWMFFIIKIIKYADFPCRS